MKRLVVIGAGRMGTEVANLAAQSGEWELAAQVDVTTAGLLETLGRADAAIDFSAPGSLDAVAAYVRRTGTPLVSGTTGLSAQQMETLRALRRCGARSVQRELLRRRGGAAPPRSRGRADARRL